MQAQQSTVLSSDAIAYAKILNQCAFELYYYHDKIFGGTVDINQDPPTQLNAWKKVLKPEELARVKEKAGLEWKKKSSNEDAAAAIESQLQLVVGCSVPGHALPIELEKRLSEEPRDDRVRLF